MSKVRWGSYRGSHLPLLLKVLPLTSGPILEFGSGYNSTPLLHWACFPTKRRLVTYENNPFFFDFAKSYGADFHDVQCVENLDAVDLSGPWSIAFVDSDPQDTRVQAIARLLHAEYLVVHDTERRREHRRTVFADVFTKYRWHYQYREARPNTSVLSNVHDLTGFAIP
jgi:predicted O-methyltransferase YrrM